jgi:hypothetical protein
LAHYSGYDEEEIEPVFKLMVDYLARPVTHEAFFKKYASKKFLKGKETTYPNGSFDSANLVQLRFLQDNGPRDTLPSMVSMLPCRLTWLPDSIAASYYSLRTTRLASIAPRIQCILWMDGIRTENYDRWMTFFLASNALHAHLAES